MLQGGNLIRVMAVQSELWQVLEPLFVFEDLLFKPKEEGA